jgi:type IV secretion system protein VirB6
MVEAPIQSLISTIDSKLAAVIGTVAGQISNTVTPIVAVCFSIYMILIVINYMRGGTSDPVWDFVLRMAAFSVIIGIGLNMGNYTTYVVPMVQETGNSIAKNITGASAGESQLDQLALTYINVIDKDYQRVNATKNPFTKIGEYCVWFIKSALVFMGLIPFLVFATALLIIAKVGSALIAAVGPIFFGCLLFPATRQYFSAWLNSVVSYMLIPVFVAVVAMISIQISSEIFDGKMNFIDVVLACIVNLILVMLIKTCSALASSLSAGGINTGFSAGGAYSSAVKAGTYTGGKMDAAVVRGIGKGAQKAAAFGANVAAAMKNMTQNGIKPG